MASPQLQSRFVAILPREIRDQIYLELWRHTGLRQHILWHNEEDATKSHLCRFPCNTEFTFQDPLQTDIEDERTRQGISLGHCLQHKMYTWRLQSPWQSHWACGEAAERMYGMEAITSCSTAASCFKQRPQNATVSNTWVEGNPMFMENGLSTATTSSAQPATQCSSYLPMLLSCKLISSECLKSIYESTTFVFTDMLALQFFLGFCSLPHWIRDSWPKIGVTPPGLFSYATRLEISLPASFSYQVYCSADPRATDPLAPALESAEDVFPFLEEPPELHQLHNAYDFHWLRLGEFQNLRSLKIWITARGIFMPDPARLLATPDLNFAEVKHMISSLGSHGVRSVDISMPLAREIGPSEEDGFVDYDLAGAENDNGAATGTQVRLWKRGTGDRFHPWLSPITSGGHSYDVVYTQDDR